MHSLVLWSQTDEWGVAKKTAQSKKMGFLSRKKDALLTEFQ